MIRKILTYYVSRLDEYLQKRFHQPEGMAEIGAIGNNTGEKPCKMVVTLLSIERETAGGISPIVEKNERFCTFVSSDVNEFESYVCCRI